MEDLPPARAYLFDVAPRQLLKIAGARLPSGYQGSLTRFRYGPGVFKIDYALTDPIPWKDKTVSSAATVHLGGTMEEISASEKTVWHGEHAEKPYALLAQQSLFDAERAPQGKHTAWVYCHVPSGSSVDMTIPIENQIERFAPGFRDVILARHTFNAQQMEAYNPNYVGGDINSGAAGLWQLYTRPVARIVPYSTPAKDIFICSSSTPPGGGVHGMCGYYAAKAVLKALK
jgi:phytoene dehydrogenase-like protein